MNQKYIKPTLISLLGVFLLTCGNSGSQEGQHGLPSGPEHAVNLLLITLDTTRADHMGYENQKGQTPNLDKLASRGMVFHRAFCTVPMTLPSHASMMTGLYPSGHGIHENARYLKNTQPLLAEKLRQNGYGTAAFLGAYPLSSSFGLARGFDHYDDHFPQGASERSAEQVNQAVWSYLDDRANIQSPQFLWVHYFDPHAPYAPSEPFRTRFIDDPYLGEIAYMDHQIGLLLSGLKTRFPKQAWRILIVGDHGEGLGDHGEMVHGNLLYNATIHVPLIITGDGVEHSEQLQAVSTRRVFNTFLNWAGQRNKKTLLHSFSEPVMAEAMKPYLQYGWQPLKMVIIDSIKTIQSGEVEVYNLDKDPGESHNLAEEGRQKPALEALSGYPLPSTTHETQAMTKEEEEQLASLGYVSSRGFQDLSVTGPSPQNMTFLFQDLDAGSALFVRGKYAQAIPLFEHILEKDPGNFMVCLRIAVGYSIQDKEEKAMQFFKKAMKMKPDSTDLMHYLGLHFFRVKNYDQAEKLFTKVLERTPNRIPALICMAEIAEKKRDIDGAIAGYTQLTAFQQTNPKPFLKLGALFMLKGESEQAIDAFLAAKDLQGDGFQYNLDLGVCYLALDQRDEARNCLDQVVPDQPGYAMALFKRAQVSVLLHEQDSANRIQFAYQNGNAHTKQLIEKEQLFNGISWK